MGQRERRRRQAGPTPTPAPAAPRGYARAREGDEAGRAALAPLKPGERPGAVTAAALVAAALAVANFVCWLAGVEIQGNKPSAFGVLTFVVLMGAAAVGIWRVRYWGLLGFQALLALIVFVFFLFLLTASNGAAVAVWLVAMA